MMRKIAFLLIVLSTNAFSQNQLLIPDTLSGNSINLNLQKGEAQFRTGQPTHTMGVNGNILGPTLLLKSGDPVDIRVVNNLGEPTTIHWHGMHVSASNDGGPHTVIPPGTTWNPSFTVMDKAGTFWYHPHLHENTNKHVSLGIAGFIIVEDEEENSLILPRTYGIDDFPLVIQTKDFDENNQIVVPSNNDDVLMVNATQNPELEVPAQVVRLRLLNGASNRVFNFGLSDNIAFYQIASDGGLLQAPVSLTRLMLAPGERAEILVDFSNYQNQQFSLRSYASELPSGMYGAKYPGMSFMMNLEGYNPNPLNGADFDVLTFNVSAPSQQAVYTIPEELASSERYIESQADTNRSLIISPQQMGPSQLNGNFLINGSLFNLDVINFTIPLNNTEIWTLTNQSAIAHPFHIHDVQFYILDRNGQEPPPNEQGRKDVVLVQPMETVRFITRFSDFADDPVPYMLHCHMLTHEDNGMMLQFEVVSNSNSIDMTNHDNNIFEIYPNPFDSELIINQSSDKTTLLKIIDIKGDLNLQYVLQKRSNKIDTRGLQRGIYVIQLIHPDGIQHHKLIKN